MGSGKVYREGPALILICLPRRCRSPDSTIPGERPQDFKAGKHASMAYIFVSLLSLRVPSSSHPLLFLHTLPETHVILGRTSLSVAHGCSKQAAGGHGGHQRQRCGRIRKRHVGLFTNLSNAYGGRSLLDCLIENGRARFVYMI